MPPQLNDTQQHQCCKDGACCEQQLVVTVHVYDCSSGMSMVSPILLATKQRMAAMRGVGP